MWLYFSGYHRRHYHCVRKCKNAGMLNHWSALLMQFRVWRAGLKSLMGLIWPPGRSLLNVLQGDCRQGWTSSTSDLYRLDVCHHISSLKWKLWNSFLLFQLGFLVLPGQLCVAVFITQEDSKNSCVQPWNGWEKLLAGTSLALQRAANWEKPGPSFVAQKALNFEAMFIWRPIFELPVAVK